MSSKCTMVVLILAFSWLEGISAAAFSNVVVQRGPLEYINYNPSSVSLNSQLAHLSAAPLENVLSLPGISPCVSPCVIPNGPIPALTPFTSTANGKIVGYRSPLPNVPVILSTNDEARGYQYAYAVYDDQTGDKKTQSEHSDGSVVQGQYSFIQPDGFRRLVVYTADDLKGFHAVVKNISPEEEHSKEEHPHEEHSHEEHSKEGHFKEETPDVSTETKQALPPCTEVKNEHLTQNHASHEQISEENHEVEHMEVKNVEEKSAENVSKKENESHESHESHQESHHIPKPINANIPNAIVSYNDIINCLQAKLHGTKNVVSPLTYVLIPSSKSPC